MDTSHPSGALDFQLLHQDDRLRIEASPGRSRRLMVSFTSVGTERDEWPPREFVKMVSQGGRNHLICVTDFSRSWMNHPGMDKTILQVVADYVAAQSVGNIMTVGGSMGAYNALIFGRLMPVQRVIAFAPQYSVHPEIMPDETRWQWFRQQITDWPHPQMDALPGLPAQVYLFHGDSAEEQMHWRRFPKAENARHYIFPGSDHNFIRRLKAEGMLRKIMISAIRDDATRMNKLVRKLAGLKREEYDQFEEALAFFQSRRKRGAPSGLN